MALVTKHYYSGSQRIATRLSGNVSAFNAAEQEDLGMQGASLFGRQLNDINHTFEYFNLAHLGIWNVPGLVGACGHGEEVDYITHPDTMLTGSQLFNLFVHPGNPKIL